MSFVRMIWLGILAGSLARAQTPQAVVGPGGIAVDTINGTVYWADEGTDRIQKSALDGTGIADVVTAGLDDPRGLAVDLAAGKIYWGDSQSQKIQRANLDGSGIEDLITAGIVNPLDLVLDPAAGKMYWLDAATKQIQRANLDGSQVEELLNGGVLLAPKGITLDTTVGKLYWSDSGSSTVLPAIQRANLDGTGIELVARKVLDVPNGIALDLAGGKMYFVDIGMRRIQRANLDGTSREDVVMIPTSPLLTRQYIALDLSAGKIYWSHVSLYRANLDGSQIEVLTTGVSVTGFALDVANGHVYILQSGGNTLERRDLNGSNPVTITSTDNYASGLTLDLTAGKVYWTVRPQANPILYRANLDGSAVEQVLTDPGGSVAMDLAIDTVAGKVYWTTSSTIRRANLDGSNFETVIQSPSGLSLWGLALDPTADLMYWTESVGERIRRANLDGSNPESLIVTLASAEGMALRTAEGKLYWADSGNDRILRMDLDGTNVEDLVTIGLKNPHRLALDEGAGRMYWTEGRSHSAKVNRSDFSGDNVETLVPGTGNTIEITCVPLGGTTVLPGQIVEVECFVWTDIDQTFVGGQLDLPCSLPPIGGATGTITFQSSTADADDDGIQESSNGTPFLFGTFGLLVYAPATCVTLTQICLSCPAVTLPGGSTRFLAAHLFEVSDCATGEFQLGYEDISQPPESSDTTRYRDGDNSPAQGNLIPILHTPITLTVVPFPYGDVNQSGVVDVDDIVCVLDGFRGLINCAGGDLAPCGGNGLLDVDDIIAVLDAFRGFAACPPPDPCPG